MFLATCYNLQQKTQPSCINNSIYVCDILMWCIMYKNYINMYDYSKVRELRADKMKTEYREKIWND